MRRRRLLAVACAAVAGCTGTSYRASGPRTPPPSPATDVSNPPTQDPVEARAQAVVRPLNEVYRAVRGPLSTFEVADVSQDERSTVRESIEAARTAITTFSEVDNPPARYASLPTLVTAHERLVDAFTAAVDLDAALSAITVESEVDDPAGRLAPLRSTVTTLTMAADDLTDLADSEPTVPPALFLTIDRIREFAAILDAQSTALDRLLDGIERDFAASADWRTGIAAFERGAFVDARAGFDDALAHYREAAALFDAGVEAEGSFDDDADRWSCVSTAGVEAATTARRAAETADAGDVQEAERTLETARTARTRCGR
ncbi:hypothetical protein [Salinigranum sp. GCM10025319]|uniref:hypothetical protein n=1 Tax=Salinigranum sp. GCM10025319 TaxID=3252687 RepID=UPI00360F2090